MPSPLDTLSYRGKNIWELPPYAELPADFGGKVGSMVAVNAVLYALGGLLTRRTTARIPFTPADLGPKIALSGRRISRNPGKLRRRGQHVDHGF